jgi:CHAT domain-containing protein/tetratricopeptide (TPR) repeat protein
VSLSDALDRAEELKALADRSLNVDSGRSLALADEIRGLGSADEVQALGWLARADALRELGRHGEALAAYDAAAALYQRLGDEVGWARTRVGALGTVRYTGHATEVLAELPRAQEIFRRRELWLRLARLESHAGLLFSAVGRGSEAVAAHGRALAAAELLSPRDSGLEADMLGNLALAHYQVDEFETAERLHRQAIATFERDGRVEHVARAHRNLARLAVARGHYSAALAAVLPGRRALRQVGRAADAAQLGQIGVDCLIRLNRPAEAAALAADVVDEFEATGARVDAAATAGLHGLALNRLGQSAAALARLAHAEALFGAVEWDSGSANVRLGRAVVLHESGAWAAALREADGVRDELRERGFRARAAEAELVRARALRALGEDAAAAVAVESALALTRDRALPALGYQAWRLQAELAQAQGELPRAVAAYDAAIAQLELVQGRILTEYRTTFLADKVDVYEAAVDLRLQRGETELAFELAERARARALVDALAGGLDIRVRAESPAQRALVVELDALRRQHAVAVEAAVPSAEVQPLEREIERLVEELRLVGTADLERLDLLAGRVQVPRAQLGLDSLLLEYFTVGKDLVVFVIDRRGLRSARLRGAAARVQRLVRAWQLQVATAAGAPARRPALRPAAERVLQRLFAELIAPLEPLPADTVRLVVVPHGALHQVPFAALHDGTRYLVERYEVSRAPSATSLTSCLRPRARDTWRSLVAAHSSAGALPGVLAEADAVAAAFPGECWREAEVTVARLRAAAPAADLLHLAAHGVARLDAPAFSYIRLADGPLTALECFELELDAALVTLSACESGQGPVVAGDEQIGLPRAFLYAGARAVLYSLWRIDDVATQRLMARFYTSLRAAGGRGRAAALRTAQLAELTPDSHPFLWAGLTLVGDWR